MALLDVLKQIGLTLGQVGAQGGQSMAQAMLAQSSPLAYQEQNQNARLAAQLSQQLNLHNTISPYEQGMLDIQSHAQHRLDEQQAFEQGHQALLSTLNLAQDVHSGVLTPTTSPDETAAFTDPWTHQAYKVNPQPPTARPFHFVPSADELKAYPWLQEMYLSPDKVPAFMNDMAKLDMNNPVRLQALGDSVHSQIDTLMPDQPGLAQTYHFLVDDAIKSGNRDKALSVLDDARKVKEEAVKKAADITAQFGPAAIAGKAAIAGAEEESRSTVKARHAAANFRAIYEAVKNGQDELDHLLSAQGSSRGDFLSWARQNNLPMPAPLSPQAMSELRKVEPIIHQFEALKSALEPLKNNNDRGYFFAHRLAYWSGVSDQLTGLINQAELDKVTGGVRVLGNIRNYQALRDAQTHLPNMWKDSPSKAYEQVENVLENSLYSARDAIMKNGNKYGVVTDSPRSNAVDDLVKRYGGR